MPHSNKNNKILLSVVIPTKNRYSTLFPVLSSLCKYIGDSEIEFIIQDNSDDNSPFLDFLVGNEDDVRIKYEYIKNEKFSIKENTERAIERINGKFSIFIGDDDLISPYILNFVRKMDQEGVKCLIYDPGYYWWDTVKFVKIDYFHRKKAFWYYDANKEFTRKESEREIDFTLKNGAVNIFGLPRFYHGIVETNILKRIRNRTGNYLNGSSPDMAFAMSLALEMKDYYHVKYPISIYGASKNSGGGWSAEKKHNGKIEEQKHLPSNILDIWDKNIPKIWSEHTIYAETASEILKIYGDKRKVNYTSLYATMLAIDFNLKDYLKGYVSISFNFIKILIKRYLGKLKREIQYKLKKFGYKVILLEDVQSVMEFLKKEYK